MQQEIKHWSYYKDENNICWLSFNKENSSVNTLDREVLTGLDLILEELNSQSLLAVIICSDKDNGFIYGADIESFRNRENLDEARELIAFGQRVFSNLANLKHTTIAMIEGVCLGGGLELALACDYRVAADDLSTRFGLPEVLLGIQPGWGGSVRLPRLIGIFAAMDLMLSGRLISSKSAKKNGLITAAVPKRLLKQAAAKIAEQKPEKNKNSKLFYLYELKPMRNAIASIIENKLSKRVKQQHYPAPYQMVKKWRKHGVLNDYAFEVERESISKLFETNTSSKLIDLFFLRNKLKKLGDVKNCKIKHVHVIGAGVMGADIAAWCAYKGLNVTLQDLNLEVLAKANERIVKFATRKFKDKIVSTQMLDRVIFDSNGYGLKRADLVIEAVAEDLSIKREVFHAVEQGARSDAVLATNTSTIPLEELAIAFREPSRLVGIHFFNPVGKMELVEVVKSSHTAEEHVVSALNFTRQIDKLPICVKSSPGFLVNRILLPYMLEATLLLEEGLDAEVIDKAARGFGMMMGPVELADTVGLDICLAAATKLSEELGFEVPHIINKKVAAKELGVKTGKGFYSYKNGRKIVSKNPKNAFIPKDVEDRLILRLLNEAVACLIEGIIEDSDYIDAASVFGFGFAPFTGGIMNYINTEGAGILHARLKELENKYGHRFAADEYWEKLITD